MSDHLDNKNPRRPKNFLWVVNTKAWMSWHSLLPPHIVEGLCSLAAGDALHCDLPECSQIASICLPYVALLLVMMPRIERVDDGGEPLCSFNASLHLQYTGKDNHLLLLPSLSMQRGTPCEGAIFLSGTPMPDAGFFAQACTVECVVIYMACTWWHHPPFRCITPSFLGTAWVKRGK